VSKVHDPRRTTCSKVPSSPVFSEFRALKNLKFEDKYLSYFHGNPFQGDNLCHRNLCL
jgi:hypothetical protein